MYVRVCACVCVVWLHGTPPSRCFSCVLACLHGLSLANVPVEYTNVQHWVFYPLMATARINLYIQSLLFVAKTRCKAVHKPSELLAIALYFTWVGALLSTLPAWCVMHLPKHPVPSGARNLLAVLPAPPVRLAHPCPLFVKPDSTLVHTLSLQQTLQSLVSDPVGFLRCTSLFTAWAFLSPPWRGRPPEKHEA